FLRSASIAGLRRDAVQPDIEAERKKRDEIEAGKSYCSRRFGGATCDDKSAQIYRSEERRVGKECRSRWSPHHQKKKADFFLVRSRAFRAASRAHAAETALSRIMFVHLCFYPSYPTTTSFLTCVLACCALDATRFVF